jgi:1-acyl-sn-glycerol-3-phosphate acyltransferase
MQRPIDLAPSRSGTLSLLIWMRALPVIALLAAAFLLLRLCFSRRRLDGFLKGCCRVSSRVLGIRIEVEGAARLDPVRRYTFMINHVTAIDHLVAYGVIPRFGRGLEAAENFRIPVYGWIARAVDNFPVERRNPLRAKESLEACEREALEQGFSVFCAPEGTRSRDGFLGPLKSGVFHLASRLGRDIVPVALAGLHACLPPGEWRLRPGKVKVLILEPIPVRDADGRVVAIDELKARVRAVLVAAGIPAR